MAPPSGVKSIQSIQDIPNLNELYPTSRIGRHLSPGLDDDSAGEAARVECAVAPSLAINARVSIYHGDITKLALDAIVNAANSTLLGGGGVDGAIHRAAGPGLLQECRTLNGCAVGDAKLTLGYNLAAKHVIHTVGPVYNANDRTRCRRQLESCYKRSLEVAVNNGIKTVAFCAVSTGVYGYPSGDAATVASQAVREFLQADVACEIERVVFVTFEPKDVSAYDKMIPKFFPPAE